MVLTRHNPLVLQPNLNQVQAKQEDVILQFNRLTWKSRKSDQEYQQVHQVLVEEGKFGDRLRREPTGQEVIVIERIIVIPRRNRQNFQHIQDQLEKNNHKHTGKQKIYQR